MSTRYQTWQSSVTSRERATLVETKEGRWINANVTSRLHVEPPLLARDSRYNKNKLKSVKARNIQLRVDECFAQTSSISGWRSALPTRRKYNLITSVELKTFHFSLQFICETPAMTDNSVSSSRPPFRSPESIPLHKHHSTKALRKEKLAHVCCFMFWRIFAREENENER